MLSQTAEYSLRAVCCLADHPGQSLTIRQIAGLTQTPVGYLAKILSRLSRAGLVTGQRGIKGGYAMRVEPSAITLLDVVKLADPSHRIEKCPLGLASHCGSNLCALHRRIDSAAAAAEAVLQDSTVKDVLADPRYRRPLREDEPAPVPPSVPAPVTITASAASETAVPGSVPAHAPAGLTTALPVLNGVSTYAGLTKGR